MTTPFICHVEWGTPDPKSLHEFLTKLFRWEFQTFAPGYLMHLPAGGGVSVGIIQSDQMRAGTGAFAFIAAPDGNLFGMQQV